MDKTAIAWYRERAEQHGGHARSWALTRFGSVRSAGFLAYQFAREAAHYAALVIEDRERTIDAPISPAYLADTSVRWLA